MRWLTLPILQVQYHSKCKKEARAIVRPLWSLDLPASYRLSIALNSYCILMLFNFMLYVHPRHSTVEQSHSNTFILGVYIILYITYNIHVAFLDCNRQCVGYRNCRQCYFIYLCGSLNWFIHWRQLLNKIFESFVCGQISVENAWAVTCMPAQQWVI